MIVLVAATLAAAGTRLGKATRAVADNPALAAVVRHQRRAGHPRGVDRRRRARRAVRRRCSASPRASTTRSASRSCCWSSPPCVLGGLGTIWGAIVGAFVVGLFIEVSTLFVPGGAEVRRRAGRAHHRPAGPAAGHPGPTPSGSAEGGTPWTRNRSSASRSSRRLGPDRGRLRLAAIGLNVHFGYTGLLNFGQAGFMAVAGYGMASIVATWGLPFWLGLVVGLAARGRAGPAARYPDAAAAGRLPRDRDDRGGRDHPADDRLGQPARSTSAAQDGLSGFIDAVPRPQPLHAALRHPGRRQRGGPTTSGC